MDISRDIHPLTDFKRNTTEFLAQLKQTGDPVVLTINGRAEIVVQDASAYQKLLEQVKRQQILDGIRQGLDEMKAGKGRPAADVLADIARDFDLSPEA